MTRALVAVAISERQPWTALTLIASGVRAASTLPATHQLELAIGVAEEVVVAAKDFVAARVLGNRASA